MSWDDYKDIPYCTVCFRAYDQCKCKYPKIDNKWDPYYAPPKWYEQEQKPLELDKLIPPSPPCPVFTTETWEDLMKIKKATKAKKEPHEAGYYDGQADALAFLFGDVGVDDSSFAPCHKDLAVDFALFMLGVNFAVAGALERAFRMVCRPR